MAAPFGAVGIVSAGELIHDIEFLPHAYPPAAPTDRISAMALNQLECYFADPDFRFNLPLARRGSEYRRRIWAAIAEIPRGRTRTYGELAHAALVALGLWLAPAPAVAVLVLPYVLTRFFLMAGNWAQHAFVHPDGPADGVRNATILVNASHNHRCFNDGYHAVHHRHPALHWAEMSAHFRDDWRHYAERGVIVFDGIPNNQVVWWRLMRKDYAFLAERMLDLGVHPAALEARVAMLKGRVQGA